MEFSWKTSFLLLTLVSVLFQTSNQLKYFYVHRCPSTEQSWKHQSQRLNCTPGLSSNAYHCLPTSENRLIELCYYVIGSASKDGCLYFSMDDGFRIRQRECIGNRSGCPEAISEYILSSEGYKFPNCLIVPGKKNDIEESTMHDSTTYTAAEKHDITKAKEILRTRRGNIARVEGLFFSIPALLLGGGIFILICIFIGCLDYLQCKRITRLLQRVESTNDISSETCNASCSNSVAVSYQQSQNETTHDYAYTENETVRPVSETAIYLESSV